MRGVGRGRADYNEWGEITYREALDITSSYRRIWPQSSYTGHDWDDVLGMYYAKARFYSAEDKRFVAMDPIKGNVTDPLSLVPYLYCVDNPLRWVDPTGTTTHERLNQIGREIAVRKMDLATPKGIQQFTLEILATSGFWTGFHNIAQVILFSKMWRENNYFKESIVLEYSLYDKDAGKFVYADAVGITQNNKMEIFEVKPAWHLRDNSVNGRYEQASNQLGNYVKLACVQRNGQIGKYGADVGRNLYNLDVDTIIFDCKLATFYMSLSYRNGVIGYQVYRKDKPGRKNARVGIKTNLTIEQAQKWLDPYVKRYMEGKTVDAEEDMYRMLGKVVVGFYAVSAVAIVGTTAVVAGLGSIPIAGTVNITSDNVAIVAGAAAVSQATSYVASQGPSIINTAEAIANHLESSDYVVIVQFGEAFYKLIAAYSH